MQFTHAWYEMLCWPEHQTSQLFGSDGAGIGAAAAGEAIVIAAAKMDNGTLSARSMRPTPKKEIIISADVHART